MARNISMTYQQHSPAETLEVLRAGRDFAANAVGAAFDTLFAWAERARQRRALGRLDDRLLADIGVSPSEAAAEVAKPFWRR